MSRRFALGFACALVALLLPSAGRAQAEEPRPLILLLEGVGGIDLIQVAGDIGFGSAGLPHEVRRFYWSHGFGRFLRDLQDTRHLLAKGAELAREVLRIKQEQPGRRIFLVGHSGGTGVAVRAAELLPPASVDRIVLLSSALSPGYDLRAALRASKGGIVAYHSRHDYLLLSWGTRQFGTVDRCYEVSAGCTGFTIPADLGPEDQALYEHLVQIPWSPRMILRGNFGSHNGTVFPSFLACEVARWLE